MCGESCEGIPFLEVVGVAKVVGDTLPGSCGGCESCGVHFLEGPNYRSRALMSPWAQMCSNQSALPPPPKRKAKIEATAQKRGGQARMSSINMKTPKKRLKKNRPICGTV